MSKRPLSFGIRKARPLSAKGRGLSQIRPKIVSPKEKAKQEIKKKPLNVRKEFPETWLWTEKIIK